MGRFARTGRVLMLVLVVGGGLAGCGDDGEDCDSEDGCGPFVCTPGAPETRYCTEIRALSSSALEVARSSCEPYHGDLVRRSCSRQGVIGGCLGRVTHGDRGTTVRTRWYYEGYDAKSVEDVRMECERFGEDFVAP
jgi:hypothetical protein